jgi:myo-inositol catabolism protein IolC
MIEAVPPIGLEFRAGDLAQAISAAVASGLEPDWWKLPDAGADEWRRLGALLDEAGSRARLVPLGGDRPAAELLSTFRAVRLTGRGGGFAVGRSVFAPAWSRFLDGERSDDLAADVAARTVELVDFWRLAGEAAVA